MLTVLESIKLSTEYLEKKGIESPRTNAELLLADILGCKRLDLYLKFDRPISEEERLKYRDFIARRGKFEPLQYILGHVEFYGMKFFVDPSVLIPRQETEILIETIIEENKGKENLNILDIGAGSGNIAICLAKLIPGSTITTIDISEKALQIARKNSELHKLEDKVLIQKYDIMSGLQDNLKNFDLVVSNPPYVDEEQYKTLQKEITAHEPREAVTDNSDGYKFYERISQINSELLKNNGRIYFEVGIGQSEKVQSIMNKNNLTNVRATKDYLNVERVISGEKR